MSQKMGSEMFLKQLVKAIVEKQMLWMTDFCLVLQIFGELEKVLFGTATDSDWLLRQMTRCWKKFHSMGLNLLQLEQMQNMQSGKWVEQPAWVFLGSEMWNWRPHSHFSWHPHPYLQNPRQFLGLLPCLVYTLLLLLQIGPYFQTTRQEALPELLEWLPEDKPLFPGFQLFRWTENRVSYFHDLSVISVIY